MNSSSERLLELLRKLEYDGDENYNFVGALNIENRLQNVNRQLSTEWSTLYDFFRRIEQGLADNLRVVRNELEIYSQSSISIESDLETVVREVYDTANSILKELKIVQ